MYWVGGLAPLATNVVTPMITRARFQHTALSPDEQRKNVLQESSRQLVSAMTHLLTYFGSSLLLRRYLKGDNQNMALFLMGTLSSFVGYAFIRPLISSELILRWVYGNASAHPATQRSHEGGDGPIETTNTRSANQKPTDKDSRPPRTNTLEDLSELRFTRAASATVQQIFDRFDSEIDELKANRAATS
jgi:hypothetical protein